MVNLLTGPKGSGKTQQMIDLANQQAKACSGNVVFIKNSHRDTSSVAFDIRVVCMDDYDAITNIDEYIGFLYGMYSANHDVEYLYRWNFETRPHQIRGHAKIRRTSGKDFRTMRH